MAGVNSRLGTGIAGLDRLLCGLLPGDNVVWHVDSIRDYIEFVKPFCEHAVAVGEKPIYFRFASHEPLLPEDSDIECVRLRPELGFETLVTTIHSTIREHAPGGVYVFDSLSELADAWFSDQMLTSFFMLTCPYLYDVQALAYFAVISKHHALHVRGPIGETAQILIDVYRHDEKLYVQPIKVQQRHAPDMHTLHAWEGPRFLPITESAVISEILTFSAWEEGEYGSPVRGVYRRLFSQARELSESIERNAVSESQARTETRDLYRRVLTRDERLLDLSTRYIPIADVVDIQKRLVGSGQIGGKAVGMLLARSIVKQTIPRLANVLEPHDSFYIGSDAFYSFLVDNGCWWERQRQRNPETLLDGAPKVRQLILRGQFPEYMLRQFSDIIDYYGQSPLIVRSSSLLEDSFGSSFSGKYDSVFCANQGSHANRLQDFLHAVRTVYASCMSDSALLYRARRGLLDKDEQMALLVQRVSGAVYGDYFFPQCAGVGFSHNPYVWNQDIDPEAGVLRVVCGMGTRAVDRSDDDYTRIVALNAPHLRPESNFDELRKYAQRRVDVLDLHANLLVNRDFQIVAERCKELPIELFASRDDMSIDDRSGPAPWLLTFDKLLSGTAFVQDAREILAALERAYDHPVDIEFTLNFFRHGGYRIDLVQCRPFLVRRGSASDSVAHRTLDQQSVILKAHGAVVGRSRALTIDRLVCVMPNVYSQLSMRDRYAVARAIGAINHGEGAAQPSTVMLLGPGRWGTSTPSLGVPVRFAEINTVSVLCELVAMGDHVIPDVSLGAHFFNELVEADMLYLALFPGRQDNFLNESFLATMPNRLSTLLPGTELSHVIHVVDSRDIPGQRTIALDANAVDQTVLCYLA